MNRFQPTISALERRLEEINEHLVWAENSGVGSDGDRELWEEEDDIKDAIQTLKSVYKRCGESNYDDSPIRLVLTFEDGRERAISQNDLDMDWLVYSKYGESVKKIRILGSPNDQS